MKIKQNGQFKALYELYLLNPKFKRAEIKISSLSDEEITVNGYIIENTNLGLHKIEKSWVLDYIPTGQYIACNFNSRKQALIGSVEKLALAYNRGFDIFNVYKMRWIKMKIKELQKKLDELTKHVKEYPNLPLYYRILSVSKFTMNFEYFYNGIYGVYQLKIRFYNSLSAISVGQDYVPENIDSIDASAVYTRFIEFVENQLNFFKDDLLNDLKSGVVDLHTGELQWADLLKNGLEKIKYQ